MHDPWRGGPAAPPAFGQPNPYGQPEQYGQPNLHGQPNPLGHAEPYVQPGPYGPPSPVSPQAPYPGASLHSAPAPTTFGPPSSYGHDGPYGHDGSYGHDGQYGHDGPYDMASTHVFEPGTLGRLGAPDPLTDTGRLTETGHLTDTGSMRAVVPGAFDSDRSATSRIDFGPHEAFGPPPEPPEPEPDDSHLFTRLRRIRSHARQKRSPAKIVVVLLLLIVAAGAGLRFIPGAPFYPAAGEPGPLAAAMPFHPADITPESLGTEGFLSWAYLDLTSGEVTGSANMAETTDAESMVTAWIAADFLRRTAELGDEPTETDLADLDTMIRDDDEAATERIVAKVGGSTESIGRMVAMCHLTETEPTGQSWRDTVISARDAALMGGCLADGRAAGAEWTPWVLNEMRQVRGAGDFGIRDAFPPGERASIAIKNGWMLREDDGLWRANCLAISDTWVLTVLQRYPANDSAATDLAHVDAVCQQVVWKLTTPAQAAPAGS